MKKGDKLTLTETADGYAIQPYNEMFERQMESVEKVMRNYRNTFKKLAE